MNTWVAMTGGRLCSASEPDVIDRTPDQPIDRIAAIAADHFRVTTAAISIIEEDRQWFKARVGPVVCETPQDWGFCDHAVRLGPGGVLVVQDAARDPRFAANPLVVGAPHLRFYAGAVLTAADGRTLGTLCVLDRTPRDRPSDADLMFLKSLARLVADQLELSRARRLLDEKQRLMGLAEAMAGIGHWSFDPASGAVTWSDQVYRIHGLPVGTDAPDYATVQTLYHEEDRAILTGLVDRAIATGEGYEFTLRIRRPDGQIRHTLAKAECTRDASGRVVSLIGLFQDITDQHVAAVALTESEHRYRLLANNSSDVISVYDADGRFRYVSPSIEEMLGYRPDEMLGRSPYEFIIEEDHGRVAAAFALHAERGDRMTIEYRARAADGRVRWLEAKPRFHRDTAGRVVEITDSVRDVTERREREAALCQARADAEAAARAKSTFLANMSHEIRTPMNGVIGFTELLLGGPLDDSQRAKARMIADSGAAMIALLNDILDLSKIEVGQMTIARHPFDLRKLLHGCAALMKPLVDQKGLEIMTEIADRVPQSFLGDDLRLRQVILNLIGNAVKFTDRGTVSIAATVVDDGIGEMIEISVSDTGIGIAPEHQTAIFSEFVQVEETPARRYGGSGLGLAISAELVRLMSGTITLSSALGMGTSVRVRIPMRSDRTSEAASEPVPEPAPVVAGVAGPVRVLVAEDHPINQELIRAMLARLGIVPDIVEDGEAATRRVLAAAGTDAPYDLVLMDLQMPVRDGLDATRAIRAGGLNAGTLPIVALTANAYASDVAACLEAGMQGHLAKPIGLVALDEVLRRWIADPSDAERMTAGAC